MGKSTTRIVVVLAAVFVLIAVLQARRTAGPDSEGSAPRALFPDLDLTAVAEVHIENAGAGITLRRGEEDQWGVEERGGYPVEEEKLRRLALAIAQLHSRDRLTDNPEKYSAVGLGDPPENGTVTLQDADGKVLALLRLGQRKLPKGARGSSGQFVRVGEDPAVYLVASAPTADTGAATWIDRKLLDLPADQVMGVAVAHDEGGFSATRKQPADPLTLETPLPAGRSADSGTLGDLGRVLVNLTADDVLEGEDEAMRGLAFDVRFTADSAERVRYNVSLARKDDAHYARLEATALPAPPEEAEAEGETNEGSGDKPTPAAQQPDPEAVVAAFNQRHQGWTYALPKHTYDRLAKRLDDLLAEETEK